LPVSQFVQAHDAHPENGVYTADSEHDQSTLLITDNGCERTDDRDRPSPLSPSRPPGPPSQQPTLSQAITAHPTFTFTYKLPSTSSTRPMEQKGGRCSVCTKALCPRRHECNGSVNRAWCRHGHPPLGLNEKIRWSEAEVERRIAAASG
jgi:hypothetical protein